MANYTKRDQRALEMVELHARNQAIANSPKARSKPPPLPTLKVELEGGYWWMWFVCWRCRHRAPVKLQPLADRYGPDVPLYDLAQMLGRCTKCGTRRALLQRPSMEGSANSGTLALEPFPEG